MTSAVAAPLRTLICCGSDDVAQRVRTIVEGSAQLRCVGTAGVGSEAVAAMRAEGADLVVVDAEVDGAEGLQVASALARYGAIGTLVIAARDRQQAICDLAATRGLADVQVVAREVVLRADSPSDALVRTRLCLLGARRARGEAVAHEREPVAIEAEDRLSALASSGYDAIVLIGSAGTPHMLPRLMAVPAVRSACPLVIAVHHNARLSNDFASWVGELIREIPRPHDPDMVAAARGRGSLFVVPATFGGGPTAAGPDLGAVVRSLTACRLRVLACIASGMGDPVVEALPAVVAAGGRVAALRPEDCPQPSLVNTLAASGIAHVRVSVPQMAWVLGTARGAPAQLGLAS